MWQYIILALIGLAVILYLVDKLFPCLFHKKRRGEGKERRNKCDDCPGCPLKQLKMDN